MLTDREHTALDLAAMTYRYPAVREADARAALGLTPTRFHALVNSLLDRADAEAERPMDVRRLRRLREARRVQRSASRGVE